MIVLTALVKAKEGKGDDLAKVIREYAPKFLNDPGVVMYEAHRRVDNPNLFLVYEKYESKDALTFHTSAPHFKEMFGVMQPFMDGKMDVVMYQDI